MTISRTRKVFALSIGKGLTMVVALSLKTLRPWYRPMSRKSALFNFLLQRMVRTHSHVLWLLHGSSVITEDLPAGCVVIGMSARAVRPLDEYRATPMGGES